MDWKKLSKVSDNLLSGNKKSVVEIEEDVHVSEETSPLDKLEVPKKKITDNKQCETKFHDKVLILDDKQIVSIMSSPRDKRRAVLSKLTDAQRKRVLQRYLELKKVKDEEEPEEVKSVTKLDVLNIDNLAANYLFTPSEYNKSLLQEAVNTFGAGLEPKYLDFMNVILSDGTAQPQYENEVKDWFDYCESLGLNSELSNVFELLESDELDQLEDRVIEQELPEEVTDDVPTNDTSATAQLKTEIAQPEENLVIDSAQVEAYLKANFGMSLKQVKDSRIIDEYVANALSKIEERPLFDDNGDEVVPVEERPLLNILAEALDDYTKGDPQKLEALAEKPQEEQPQDISEEQPQEEQPQDISEEQPEDISEQEDVDISEDITVQDSRKIANAVLKKEFKVCDSYYGMYPILDGFFDEFIDHEPSKPDYQYSIEKSDFNPVQSVTEVPLSRDEFCSIYKTPAYFRNLCSECGCEIPQNPTVEYANPCIAVNGEQYYPYNCTVEELKEKLEQPGADIHKILCNSCVSLADACRLAAKSDNLHLIDNKFYKKSLNSPEWSYDYLPSVLKQCGVTKPSGTIQIADVDLADSQEVTDIYGTKYIVK